MMTLPFENDTSAIIKKLASAQLKKEHLKKNFTITAISLAALSLFCYAHAVRSKI